MALSLESAPVSLSSRSVLAGHFLCLCFTKQKQKLKGYSVLYRRWRKRWSMSRDYWTGNMGLSKDKLGWMDDQAFSKLRLASSAIWALKLNPALSQGQIFGLFRLYWNGVPQLCSVLFFFFLEKKVTPLNIETKGDKDALRFLCCRFTALCCASLGVS